MDEKDKKSLKKDDISLWKAVTKDIRRLAGRQYVEPVEEKESPSTAPKENTDDKYIGSISVGIEDIHKARPDRKKQGASEVDKRTDERLRRGQISIEATLDLHGMTQAKAQDSFIRFLLNAHAAGKRCVLIITGKGSLSAPSILRQNLPRWVNESPLSEIVLKHYPAQPKDGGSGAFYIYLRRQRTNEHSKKS